MRARPLLTAVSALPLLVLAAGAGCGNPDDLAPADSPVTLDVAADALSAPR